MERILFKLLELFCRNSPPSLLPGWDSCDESQSPPIENEEWLAFLHRSMPEVLDGELESLKQQNLVGMVPTYSFPFTINFIYLKG